MTVVTSEGTAHYAYTIGVHRPAAPGAFLAKVKAPFLVGKDPIALVVDPDLVPVAHAGMVLTARPKGGAWWSKESVPARKTVGGDVVLEFSLGEAPVSAADTAEVVELELGLLMRMEPGGDLLRVPTSTGNHPTVTWFKDKELFDLVLQPEALSLDEAGVAAVDVTLALQHPAALIAYPELKMKGTAKLKLTVGEKVVAEAPVGLLGEADAKGVVGKVGKTAWAKVWSEAGEATATLVLVQGESTKEIVLPKKVFLQLKKKS